ncbi:MAG: hypothetical protein VKJ64_12795 [Leptolyngbyaceae bacterium]|nr:hypothetical protein [Leptolyngbyaceae bacterium]
MNAYIVCESESDAKLLQRILPQDLLHEVEIVAAGGVSAVISLSRSLLIRRQRPLAIVIDADLGTADSVQDRQRSIEGLLNSVAIATPVKVILAIPSIEMLFFYDTGILTRLLGHEPSPELLEMAKTKPKKVLQEALENSPIVSLPFRIDQCLTDHDIQTLQNAPLITEIIDFLESVQEKAIAL